MFVKTSVSRRLPITNSCHVTWREIMKTSVSITLFPKKTNNLSILSYLYHGPGGGGGGGIPNTPWRLLRTIDLVCDSQYFFGHVLLRKLQNLQSHESRYESQKPLLNVPEQLVKSRKNLWNRNLQIYEIYETMKSFIWRS